MPSTIEESDDEFDEILVRDDRMDFTLDELPSPLVHQRYKQRSASQPVFFFQSRGPFQSSISVEEMEEIDLDGTLDGIGPLKSFPSSSSNSIQERRKKSKPLTRTLSLASAVPVSTIEMTEQTKKLADLLNELYAFGKDEKRSSPSSYSSSHYSCTSALSDGSGERSAPINEETLNTMTLESLRDRAASLQDEISEINRHLVRAVKKCAHEKSKLRSQCNMVSAVLQALSEKRRVDSQLRFSIDPPATESGFCEWRDAMKAVARLPGGVPPHFRKNLWSTLATQHIDSLGVDWDEIVKSAFSEKLLPEDHFLTSQIIKDVHRTGCPGFDSEEDRVRLKRVLLGYARYNKEIGYCQGFNIIAALILQVVDHKTDVALKIMIFLIEQVLPRGYFDQSLRALSVDMAVLKELMKERLPRTVAHLENLRANSGNEYEPGLTNVFSMHWFLTLFATCLPRNTVYRIWDAIMLEGSEVLLRTAVAIWSKIGKRVILTKTADEFYSLMENLCRELTELGEKEEDQLLHIIYSMSVFPYPGLAELREKYTWNIQPLSSTFKLFQKSVTNILHDDERDNESNGGNLATDSPSKPTGTSKSEMALLQKQYNLLRQRQKQASLILRSAYRHGQTSISNGKAAASHILNSSSNSSCPLESIPSATVFNHLYMGETLIAQANGNQVEVPSLFSGGGAVSLAPTIVQPISVSRLTKTNTVKRETPSILEETSTPSSPSNDNQPIGENCSEVNDDPFFSDSDDETITELSRPSSRRESEHNGKDTVIEQSQIGNTLQPSMKTTAPKVEKKNAERKALMKKSLAMIDSLATSKPPPIVSMNHFMRPPSKIN
ncbi:hypothetical protein PRIPAC_77182 [Pristionchus pacificus]|nr:hypothetical protein PRIPAC_77182 [Pristionchus pacificus]